MFKRLRRKEFKSGLALSGGGARGLAHLGAVKALHENGQKFDIIAGTSMGALIGAILACGYHPDEIIAELQKINPSKFVNISLTKKSFMSFEKGMEFVKKFLKYENIEDMELPFVATAVNLQKGEVECFDKGSILKAVEASISIPAIFPFVTMGEYSYVDGGLLNNLPVRPIRDRCRRVTAIYVNPRTTEYTGGKITTVLNVLERSFDLAMLGNVAIDEQLSDYYYEFDKLGSYSILNFEKMNEIIEIGYEGMKDKLKK